jgi:hypothetical protein
MRRVPLDWLVGVFYNGTAGAAIAPAHDRAVTGR